MGPEPRHEWIGDVRRVAAQRKTMSQSENTIPLSHHLYTSSEGYQTVYASPELSPELVGRLEQIAERFCEGGSSYPEPSHFVLDDFVCFLQVGSLGSDHAGRPRLCAHTSLLPREVFVATPTLNILFADESMFAGTWDDLDPLIRSLEPSIELRRLMVPQPRRMFQEFVVPSEAVLRALLGAFILRGRTTVMIGDPVKNLKSLSRISLFVPRLVRLSTAFFVGAYVSRQVDSSESRMFVLDEDTEVEEHIDRGETVIDTRRGQLHNVPMSDGHPFIEFITRLVQRPLAHDTLLKLLNFQESDPAYILRSAEEYFYYVKALQLVEPFIDPSGRIGQLGDLKVQRQNTRALTTALIHFYRAGSRNQALKILRQVLEGLLRSHRDKAKAQDALEQELVIWTEQLTEEESDTFLRSIGMMLDESGEFYSFGGSKMSQGPSGGAKAPQGSSPRSH
jgi:hypothetical protein